MSSKTKKKKQKNIAVKNQTPKTFKISIWYYIVFFIFYFLLIESLASRDIPEFIRKIPGKSFIEILLLWIVFVLAVTGIVLRIVFTRVAKAYSPAIREINLSNDDLMTLNHFNNSQRMTYYLLKGYLDRILSLKKEKTDSDKKAQLYIRISPDIPKEELEKYCKRNPKVAKIVKVIQTSAQEATINVIEAKTRFSPKATKSDSDLITQIKLKYRMIANCFFVAFVALAYYPGITKYIMGKNHSKPTGNLETFLFFIFPIILIILYKSCRRICDYYYNILLNSMFDKHSVDIYQALKKMKKNPEQTPADSETIENLLRAYILIPHHLFFKAGQNSVIRKLISGSLATQVTSFGTGNNSGYDCSSCSSCSGCSSCSSCGGCGGCGD